MIASGIMVATCIAAAKILAEEGISTKVVDIVTIKPLDEELVLQCAKETKGIVTVENANVIGGLGGAVCECLAEKLPTRVLRIGINDTFGRVGEEKFLREFYGLTVDNIVEYARRIVK